MPKAFYDSVLDQYANFLVAYYPMEQTGAAVREDEVGSNDLAPTNTPATRAGKHNNACDFIPGSLQYLSIADTADLSFTTGFAISVWAYSDDAATRMIVGKIMNGAASWYLLPDAGTLNFVMTQGNSVQKAINSVTWGTGAWKHFLAMATGSVQRIFIDGAEWGTTNAYDDTILAEAYPFFVGRDPWGNSYFDGGIDELAIWKDIVFANAAARNAFAVAAYNSAAGKFFHHIPQVITI